MPIPTVPTLLLAAGGVTLLASRWVRRSRWYEAVWLITLLGAAWLTLAGDVPPHTPQIGDAGPAVWTIDPFTICGQWLAMAFGMLFGIGSFGVDAPRARTGLRLGFLSFLMAGVMLTGASNDLVTLALAVELVQLASWGLRKVDRLERDGPDTQDREEIGQNESQIWLGIAASCCLWLGIALLANVTASTQFDQVRQVLSDAYVSSAGRAAIGSGSKLGLLGIGLIIAGLGGRLGLVPWQIGFIESTRGVGYWTAGAVLLGGQLSGVLALGRLCGFVWVGYRDELLVLLLVIAGLTCAASGSLAGLGLQSGEGRLRRWTVAIPMLHAGWLTTGLMAATADLATPQQSLAAVGQSGSLALLLFASAASLCGLAGLFLVLSSLSRPDREVEFLDELLGLGRLCPLPAAALIVVLASLAGQPPLWGFWANWLLLLSGLNVRAEGDPDSVAPHVGLILLPIVATFATLMTAAVVIRVARVVLLESPISRVRPQGRRPALFMGCTSALILVAIGLFPARLLSVVSSVRGPAMRSESDDPAGKLRGPATAQRTPTTSVRPEHRMSPELDAL